MIGGMKSFLIASIFVQPIIIGIIAQKGFGRIGVVWALIAFALNLASELAPVSLDTTLSTGTEKEWPS